MNSCFENSLIIDVRLVVISSLLYFASEKEIKRVKIQTMILSVKKIIEKKR